MILRLVADSHWGPEVVEYTWKLPDVSLRLDFVDSKASSSGTVETELAVDLGM